jgi:hypothetical protein
MNDIKKGILLVSLSTALFSYAIVVQDVQKLTVNNFFGTWSKFLDQVLQAQEEQISPENEKIYQAFVQQAKQLNIPKITGNKKSISAMKEQMEFVKKRMGDEKNILQEWTQLSETLMNAGQPILPEQQEQYKALIKQAKAVGVSKKQLDDMAAKMKEAKDKFGVVAPQSEIPAPVMSTYVKEEIGNREMQYVKEEVENKEVPYGELTKEQ